MSRLVFAAARGARIQINGFTAVSPNWYDSHKWSSMHESVLRIHPDDEHLQYGPISTELRELELWNLQISQFPVGAIHAAMACRLDSDWTSTWGRQSVGERALAVLILAEALADEGL